MVYLLYTLFILACIVLIASVLLQPGKSDAGALFTSSVSSTAFGPRGTQTILSKITIVAATIFMLAAFLLSQPGIIGNRSVLETTAAPVENNQPTAPEASPAVVAPAQGENTNVTTPASPATSNTDATTNNTANAAASPAANTAANTAQPNR